MKIELSMGIYIRSPYYGYNWFFKIPYCNSLTLLGLLFYGLLWSCITAGVHRLWSHRSYDATFFMKFVLMIFNTIANQGSIWHWVRDHRVHHKFSETDADPHNAKRGFFFAHMGWLFVKKHPRVIEAGKKLNFDDLSNDWCVLIQKKLDPWVHCLCVLFFL